MLKGVGPCGPGVFAGRKRVSGAGGEAAAVGIFLWSSLSSEM